MAFWSDNTMQEPLRQNRWFLRFSNEKHKQLVISLKECKKPKHSTSVTEHRLINHTFKYPGTVKWDPINIKLVSSRGNDKSEDVSVLFYNFLSSSGYYSPTDSLSTGVNKGNSIIEKNSLDIVQINSFGDVIEEWHLHNAYVSDTDYGSLSYSSDDFVEISATIQYDWAELEATDNNEVKKLTDIVAKEKAKKERDEAIERQRQIQDAFDRAAEQERIAQEKARSEAIIALQKQDMDERLAAAAARKKAEDEERKRKEKEAWDAGKPAREAARKARIREREEADRPKKSKDQLDAEAKAAEERAARAWAEHKDDQNKDLAREIILAERERAAEARNEANEAAGVDTRVEANRNLTQGDSTRLDAGRTAENQRITAEAEQSAEKPNEPAK
jgi:hypothetical protein